MSPSGSPAGATGSHWRRPRAVYWGMITMIFASGLAGGLGAPLVTAISRSEGVPLSVAQWSVTGGLLTAAVAAPVVGRLGGDGRQRPVLITLMALATLGTVLAALPLGIEALLIGRTLQGLGMAAQPLMMAVGRASLTPEREVSGVSSLSMAISTSAGLGFPVAAFLGQQVGVHGAFWFGVTLYSLCLLTAIMVVPAGGQVAPARFDLFGAVLLGTATLSLLLAISQSRAWGYTSVLTLGLLAFGAVALALTGWWLLRTRDPLVDLRLARHPVLVACHVAALFCGMGMYMLMTLCLILAQATPEQHGLALGVAVSGALMLPYSVLSVVGNKAGVRASRVIDTQVVLPLGCVTFAVALFMLARWHHEPWQLVLAMCIGGLGSGMAFTSLPLLMMRVVPAHELASALSFNTVLRFVGFSSGAVASVALLEVVDDHITHTGAFLTAGFAGVSCVLAAALATWSFRRAAPR